MRLLLFVLEIGESNEAEKNGRAALTQFGSWVGSAIVPFVRNAFGSQICAFATMDPNSATLVYTEIRDPWDVPLRSLNSIFQFCTSR